MKENGDCVNKSTTKQKKKAENSRMPQRCLQQILEHSASGGGLQEYFFLELQQLNSQPHFKGPSKSVISKMVWKCSVLRRKVINHCFHMLHYTNE